MRETRGLVRFAILPLILLVMAVFPVGADELHVLITADTQDSSIGESVAKDVDTIREFSQRIAQATGLELRLQIVAGRNFAAHHLDRAIGNIQAGPEDVIFYYNSSHGYRERSTQGQWPVIWFEGAAEDYTLGTIYRKLEEKNPRLLIVMGDMCNNFASSAPVPSFGVINYGNSSQQTDDNIRELFMNTQGGIISASSAPGQYSAAMYEGGSYTVAFKQAFFSSVFGARDPSWERIMEEAALPQHHDRDWVQQPVYEFVNFREEEGSPTPQPTDPVNPSSGLLRYRMDGGSVVQTSENDWVITLNGRTYNLVKNRADYENYRFFMNPDNDGYYSLDVDANVIWYWRSDMEQWVNWRELTPY